MRKDSLDGFGAMVLLGITLLLAANQIIVKEVNSGLQPVFFAGLRSVLATGFVTLWLICKGRAPNPARQDVGPGLLVGTVFAVEFLALFMALDLTTVGRASVIFYSMPVWFALMAHFGLPGQRITRLKAAGLALSFAGTALAILSGATAGGQGSLAGDLFALVAALGWAGTAYLARATSLAKAGPEMQLWWMVLVSGPLLLLVAPAFGPLIREVEPIHWAGLIFQASVVVAGGFIGWLWLLSVYPVATVASFSFLTPVFAIGLGHFIFGEPVSVSLLGSVALVAVGIVLINRRA